jgi:hypothetical protein
MKLRLERRWKKATYVIGVLFIDGIRYCETLEDADRGLKQTDPLTYISSRKVPGETAIPKGTYGVAMNVTSPKYAGVAWYWNFCRGKMPRLLNVPGFDGILIHKGVSANSSAGCIIVGYNTIKGRVTDSQKVWERLMKKYLTPAKMLGEEITITITSNYKKQ